MTGTSDSGNRYALIAGALWAAFWSLHNALPYLQMRDDSCQTMFSSLDQGADWNNHVFMPQHAVGDLFRYVELRDVTVTDDARDARDRMLTDWLSVPSHAFNMEALRVTNANLCEAHRVSFRYRTLDVPRAHALIGATLEARDEVRTRLRAATPFVAVEDACSEPRWSSPHWLIPVRLYETDFPLAVLP
jgi:hypothetical protein